MKKILTSLALLGTLVTGAYAQKTVDLSITKLFPVEGTAYANLAEGDTFYLASIVKNNGPDNITAGDTVALITEIGMTGNPGLTSTETFLATDFVNAATAGGSDTLYWMYIQGSVLGTLGDGTEVIVNYPTDAVADTSYQYIFGFNADGLFTDAGIEGTSISDDGNNIVYWTNVIFGTPSSVGDIKGLPKEAISVYPNPATNKIGFNYNFTANTTATVNVTDVTGRTVIVKELGKQVVGQKEFTLDVSALSNGMYYMELVTDEKRAVSKFNINK